MRRSNRSRGDCYSVARMPLAGHYQHDGAPARSARIRASHDHEGTRLEEMPLRTAAMEEALPAREPLRPWRLSALFARIARVRVPEQIETAPPNTGIAD
jgi:hypothetical protein